MPISSRQPLTSHIQGTAEEGFKKIVTGNGEAFLFGPTQARHADAVVELIQSSHDNGGGALPLTREQVLAMAKGGHSFIAIDPATNSVVGHQAIGVWPGCYELRSGVTHPGYRGKGINTAMKSAFIIHIFEEYPEAVIIAIKSGEMGLGALTNGFGFREEPLEEAQSKYLFGILKPEEGPWHVYSLTQQSLIRAPIQSALRD